MSSRTLLAACVLVALLSGSVPVEVWSDEPDPPRPPSPLELRDADVRRRTLFRRPDEDRPDQQFVLRVWDIPVTVGGEFGVRARLDDNRRLADSAHEDEIRFDQKLEVEFFAPLTEHVFAYVEGRSFFRSQLWAQGAAHRSAEWVGERGEMWLYWSGIGDSPFSLQIGRQRFTDEREWFWDEDLDAIRLHFDTTEFHLELAYAEQIARRATLESHIEPEAEDVGRFLGQAEWAWHRRHRVSLFHVRQRDSSSSTPLGALVPREREDKSDADLAWSGVSARGSLRLGRAGRLGYTAHLARVSGRETSIDFDDVPSPIRNLRVADKISRHAVRGTGFDASVTWSPPAFGRPSLTAGYAIATGDPDSVDHADRGFRQTALQDNNARFRGVDRFRYYGELLDPELANLEVITLAIGWPLLSNSSIELIYHHFEQDVAAPFLRDTRLRVMPDGLDNDLGWEFDVVIGLEEWRHLEIELVGAVFRAGRAFGRDEGDRAYHAAIKIDWNF